MSRSRSRGSDQGEHDVDLLVQMRAGSTYLLLDLLLVLQSLLQLGLQVADLGQVLGRLQADRSGFKNLNQTTRLNTPPHTHLGHRRLVLLHQVVQVLLVLLHPGLKVVLLPLKPTQLLLQLRDTNRRSDRETPARWRRIGPPRVWLLREQLGSEGRSRFLRPAHRWQQPGNLGPRGGGGATGTAVAHVRTKHPAGGVRSFAGLPPFLALAGK